MEKCSICGKEVSDWNTYFDNEVPFCKSCFKDREKIKKEKEEKDYEKSNKKMPSFLYIVFLIINLVSVIFISSEINYGFAIILINLIVFGTMIFLVTIYNHEPKAIKIVNGLHGAIAFFYLVSIFVFRLRDMNIIIGFIIGMIIHLICIRYLKSKFLNEKKPN